MNSQLVKVVSYIFCILIKKSSNSISFSLTEFNSTLVSFEDDIQLDQTHGKRKARSLPEVS